jgi:hypothetical protein
MHGTATGRSARRVPCAGARSRAPASEALRRREAGGAKITTRKGDVWIRVPRLAKQPEPETLQALKREIVSRWGVIDLLDVLKEVDYLTGFTNEFTTIATRAGGPTRPRPPATQDGSAPGTPT